MRDESGPSRMRLCGEPVRVHVTPESAALGSWEPLRRQRRPSGMRIAVAALLLGVLVAGCTGGQVDIASDGSGPPTPKTSVVLTRPVGKVVGTRSEALGQCPASA